MTAPAFALFLLNRIIKKCSPSALRPGASGVGTCQVTAHMMGCTYYTRARDTASWAPDTTTLDSSVFLKYVLVQIAEKVVMWHTGICQVKKIQQAAWSPSETAVLGTIRGFNTSEIGC